LRAIKELGQHFLNDAAIASDIAALGEIVPGETIWEIGPGLGILSDALITRGAKLKAFELDKRMAGVLKRRFGQKIDLTLIDILKLNWTEELSKEQAPIKIIANIPYQITSPLLYKLEEYSADIERAVFMIQKEVAERLTAQAGDKAYSLLTIRMRLKFDISLAFFVAADKFDPPPKVESAVVLIKPRQILPDLGDEKQFYSLINASFAHKRKTLRNNLLPYLGREKLEALITRSGLDFTRRAETLDEEEFIFLNHLITEL